MKKLIALLFAVLFIGTLSAQNIMNLSEANLYYKYTGVATDTASIGGTLNKVIVPNSTWGLYYDVKFKITEVSATTSTAVAFQGRKFNGDAWSTITTITYRGTGTDTTAYYTQVSTKQFYNEYRLLITPANGKVKLTTLEAYFRK